MKKILLLIAVSILSVFTANAQEQEPNSDVVTFDFKSHEFSIGYGFGAATKWMSDYDSPELESYAGSTGNFWGSINVGYVYKFSELASVGLSYTYSGVKNTYYDNHGNFAAAANIDIHVIMPEFKCNWYKKGVVTLYSRAAAGIEIGVANLTTDNGTLIPEDDKYSVVNFAFQASPLGIEFGNNFAFYAEAGFGYQGIVVAGFRYKF